MAGCPLCLSSSTGRPGASSEPVRLLHVEEYARVCGMFLHVLHLHERIPQVGSCMYSMLLSYSPWSKQNYNES